MTERWLPVVGYEGLYEVSDKGHVRSIDRLLTHKQTCKWHGTEQIVQRPHKGKMLKPCTLDSGHQMVMLGRNGSRLVHTLVLEAFVGPCPEGHECCHWDDVPDHNDLENLRWGTRSDNMHDAVRNGRRVYARKVAS